MRERTTFNPLGWLMSASFTLLTAAIALAVAVHLVQAIWPWLLGLLATSLVICVLLRLLVRWSRSRPW